jgi:integrase/recombinase XerD
MKEYLEYYVNDLRLQGRSERTVENIIVDVKNFFQFLTNKNITDLKKLNKKDVDEYQTDLYYYEYKPGKKLCTESQIKRLSSLKSFFRYMVRENLLLYNPFKGIELPRKRYVLPKSILTQKEIRKLFNTPKTGTIYGYRDRTILEVFYATGVRITELASLTVADIDTEGGYLTIREGKGLKDRTVPLNEICSSFLKEYSQNVRPYLMRNKTDILFLTKSGKPFDRSGLLKMLRGYAIKANLEKNITGHTFRHTLATELLRQGADIRQIQEILGHESLSTTQKYIRVVQDDLKKVHSKTHPREKGFIENISYRGEDELE